MLRYSYISETGGRDHNEDSVLVKSEGSILIAAVADGLGSHGGGKEASEAVVKTFSDEIQRLGKMESSEIEKVFAEANSNVVKMQTKETEMKSTAVLLVCDTAKKTFIWAHVGDSRLYHFRNGRLLHYTLDHSVPQMKVSMGEITYEQIRSDPDRNRLLRAVGGSADKILPAVSEVYKRKLPFEKNAFLLCSDGFWEYVLENEMSETLQSSSEPQEWIGKMEDILKKRANNNNDNFSVIAVME